MANRNRTTVVSDVFDDDEKQDRGTGNEVVDDIPDELDDEESAVSPGTNQGSSAGMSLEDLSGMSMDDARDEEERKRLDPPSGDWIKDDTWKFEKRVNTQDVSHGDIDSSGRTFFSVYGKPQSRVKDGIEYTPTLFIRMSPDIRYKVDDPSKVDLSYRLYLKAKDLYLYINQEKVRTFGQLIGMLESEDYLVRTMTGDNGPLVIDLKPKVNKRR